MKFSAFLKKAKLGDAVSVSDAFLTNSPIYKGVITDIDEHEACIVWDDNNRPTRYADGLGRGEKNVRDTDIFEIVEASK